jgi:hypothetical protein
MDVPEQAILELKGIGRDLIPVVPDWVGDAELVGEDTEPAELNAPTEVVDIEASAADQDSEELSTKKF